MPAKLRNRRSTTALAGVAALSTAAIALAGCGGSSSTHTSSTAQVTKRVASQPASRQTPAHSNPDVGSARSQTASKHKAPGADNVNPNGLARGKASDGRVARGADNVGHAGTVQKAHHGPSTSDDNPVAVTSINPCTLVTFAEARTIAGGVIGATEAPLGPTCIYKRTNTKTNITLAVELQSFAQVTKHMQQRKSVTIGSREAYCGTLGSKMLFVPLPSGQVLNVTAPCSVAKQFAALALQRLKA
jgi:hypothetical protein